MEETKEDELYKKFIEGMKYANNGHMKPSPETDRRLALLENDLPEIKDAIKSSTRWIITTLITTVVSSAFVFFSIGSWKGGIEVRISNIETRQDKQDVVVSSLKQDLHNIAKQEVDSFARKNFDTYER